MPEFFSYRGHFILPLASILSELNLVHNFPSYLFKAGSTNFPKSGNYLKILMAWKVLPCYFHAEGPEVLLATVQSLAARVTWHPGFVHPCFKVCINYIFLFICYKIYHY
jgi:hypothetical protein